MPRVRSPETIRKEREKLEQRLAALQAAETEQAERRALVIGRAVMAEASERREFQTELDRILEQRVTGRADRSAVGLTSPTRKKRVPTATQPTTST